MSFRNRISLRDAMIGIVEEPLLPMVPKRFDYIGNVAVISIPPELEAYKKSIASKLFSMRGNTRAVLNKVSKLEGEHRVADFELLVGETTETIHRENGYTYKLDVKKVFFNPRLYSERRRVASKIKLGENIIIPFAGVGPFVLPAAGKGAKVYAIEINPDACACLRENIRINRLEGQITVIQGDFENISYIFNSAKTSEGLVNTAFSSLHVCLNPEKAKDESFQIPKNGFDRAIVPTPYGMDHFLGEISKLVRKEGYIYFYTFKAESQIPGLINEYEKMGLEVELYRRTGNVAPGISRWVFDLKKIGLKEESLETVGNK
ncbi:class I SAM-dependent methyltransferase family protein [Methanosarcina sp.]|uniref:class I SAM-dependent methyltransferase n=1 Tax=Methanosarcina sp. TaxID=2213 RepID=UPI00298811A6|nr:class I SAM-dependent methyltransferase family protein [Methanosarcina sp.]MDW5550829.1 class I SAM-dependent methyltransferase family protein [Methanosarcina sp.]MDW5554651.1 class I SAM-dependent methyltransferase family protein [Methanosarcina sp.]MDW5560438.1 class I SAM-dependent methyltransferase family protein [Methanosarcina sp.]